MGANLVRQLLNNGATIHALIKPRSSLKRLEEISSNLLLHSVDLLDYLSLKETLKKIKPEFIFHLAAQGGHPRELDQKIESLKIDILGTTYLLEALAPLNFRSFIHVGSALEYGPHHHPIDEGQPLKPSTFRGVAKAGAGLVCLQFAQALSSNLLILRPFSVYGYWEQPRRFIPTLLRAAVQNQEMLLTSPGFVHDWIFVEDVVAACLKALCLENGRGEVFNIGSGKQWSNEEVVQQMEAVAGKKLKVRVGTYPRQPSDTCHWVADIQKAKEILHWEPQHSLSEGLKKNLDWFLKHREFYQ